MLSDFAQEKNFFGPKKHNFFQSQKESAFPKGLTHAFGQKMPFFSLFRFGQHKTRNNG